MEYLDFFENKLINKHHILTGDRHFIFCLQIMSGILGQKELGMSLNTLCIKCNSHYNFLRYGKFPPESNII